MTEKNLALKPKLRNIRAFKEVFKDHEALSDFIWSKSKIKANLEDLRKDALAGKCDCNDDVVIWLRRMVDALEDEVKELKESLPWKWWRHEKADLQNVRVEIVDIFHFLLSASAICGMTGEDFIKIYYEKRRLNYERQISGFKPNDNEKIGAWLEKSVLRSPDLRCKQR